MMNRLDGQTVAVTGCTGFIGRRLVHALRQIANLRLILLSRSDPVELQGETSWISATLEEMSSKTWSDAGIDQLDVMIHLGGFIPKAGADANNIESSFQANILGTRRLLESLPESTGRIVFSSTVDVYAVVDDVITEETQVQPPSVYGASKLFGEHLTRIYAEHHGICSSILRLGHIYGPGEERYNKLIPVVIRRVLSGEPPVIYGDGSELRDFLYVDDAVEAIIRAASVPAENIGPLNIVSGSSVSIAEVVQRIANLGGYTGGIEHREKTAEDRSFRFDPSLMRKHLGRWPLVGLEDGLSLEIKQFRIQPHRDECMGIDQHD